MWLCAWCAAEQNRFVATNHADCRIVEEKIHQRNCVCNFHACSWKRSHINTNQCVIMFLLLRNLSIACLREWQLKHVNRYFRLQFACIFFKIACCAHNEKKSVSVYLVSWITLPHNGADLFGWHIYFRTFIYIPTTANACHISSSTRRWKAKRSLSGDCISIEKGNLRMSTGCLYDQFERRQRFVLT